MTIEGVGRCSQCGMWLMINALSCTTCKILKQTEKGISDAETNQRGASMLGAGETEKGDR